MPPKTPTSEHDELVAWAEAFVKREHSDPPAGGWLRVDRKGFGLLHYIALVEGSGELALPSALFASAAAAAAAQGAPSDLREFEAGHSPAHWCVWHAASGTLSGLASAGAPLDLSSRRDETPIQLCLFLTGTIRFRRERAERMAEIRAILTSSHEELAIAACLSGPSAPVAAPPTL